MNNKNKKISYLRIYKNLVSLPLKNQKRIWSIYGFIICIDLVCLVLLIYSAIQMPKNISFDVLLSLNTSSQNNFIVGYTWILFFVFLVSKLIFSLIQIWIFWKFQWKTFKIYLITSFITIGYPLIMSLGMIFLTLKSIKTAEEIIKEKIQIS